MPILSILGCRAAPVEGKEVSVNRCLVQVPVMIALLSQVAMCQEWARKMFTDTSHSFGTVARGAKSEFNFELTNIYKEDIHIASVRASCGCVTPTITKELIKTWEKGAVNVRFNTGSFLGQRAASITLTIDRPFFAEVQLKIDGFIRGDVVFEPGAVLFGSIDQGATAERKMLVSRTGQDKWEISDVRSANPDLQVEIVDQKRTPGLSQYSLSVKLVEPKKTGFFRDQMVLITNDPRSSQLAVTIEGNVQPVLTVSPASLSLGTVAPGAEVTKQLVVRSKQPFRITDVKCENKSFEFRPSTESKELHLVPVKFTASERTGELACEIEIQTDRGPSVVGTCTATVFVVPADGPADVPPLVEGPSTTATVVRP